MENIEILATNEVATEFAFNWFNFILIIIVSIVTSIIITILLCRNNDVTKKEIINGFIATVVTGVLFGTVLGATDKKPVKYENEYKILIPENVSIEEIQEKYEILEKEGKIYTVREK